MIDKILIGTSNSGKIREIKNKLQTLGIDCIPLNSLSQNYQPPEENGKTFYENALIKAKYYYAKTGMSCLCDDSGLEVFALNNEPGINSARFAGENATDQENNEKLLKKLKSENNTDARFVCVMVLYLNKDNVISSKGYVNGKIIDTPRGKNGFGYDPIFYLPEYGKTIAEFDMNEKNKISHRAKALEELYKKLKS